MHSNASRTRAPGIDIARALAVIGVVATHTVSGMLNSSLIDSSYPAYEWIQNIGMLRLPALAFLTGLFIPSGIAKRGASRYMRIRLVSLGYLYVLWSLIQGTVAVAFAGYRNGSGGTWLGVLSLWTPEGQLWFLTYLMTASVLLTIFRPWKNGKRAIASLVLFLCVTLLMWGRQYNYVGIAGLSLIFFSALGATMGMHRAVRILNRGLGTWIAVGAVSTSLFIALLGASPQHPASGTSATPPQLLLPSLLASTVGCIALVACSQILFFVPYVARPLQLVGQRTLEVFVMHYSLYAGTRVLLMHAGVENPAFHLVAGISVGVLVPVFLSWLLPRIGMRWLFQPPSFFMLDGRSLLAKVRLVARRGALRT
ncbi:acyltransferase family protein [Kocuria sediminis]